MKYKMLIYTGVLLIFGAVFLAACGPEDTDGLPPPDVVETDVFTEETQEVEETQATTETEEPETTDEPAGPLPVDLEIPFMDEWMASPHADAQAEAFVHWNEDDPAEVPVDCAKCHSTPGYIDFVGADGSEAGVVDEPAPVGTVITCTACHNNATQNMTSVVFPSGVEVTGLGDESRCMQCHQGRASKVQVDEAIADLPDLDTPGEELSFINIHYYAAAATMYGSIVHGGYEYDGNSYDAKFDHVEGYNTCAGCHNPHSLELKVEECAICHSGVSSREDLVNIRMVGSLVDYDGDGDMEEGIAGEIETLQQMTLQAIQTYASEVVGTAIGYNAAAHPYFFIDANESGEIEEDEANRENAYNTWTGRLLKAAYNYQTSLKDPGAYAHGGKYMIQLLYDSIEDLNSTVDTQVDLSQARRIDNGHFAGSEEAFRHWDAEEFLVPGDCAKCHSPTGLPIFLGEASRARDQVSGVVIAQPAGNGLQCETCHDNVVDFTRYQVNQVRFPSGAILSFGEAEDPNLCLECHQGRESTVSVQRAITTADVGDDEVSEALTFRNPHYFATGATLFGNQAMGAYQYEGMEYSDRFMHVEPMDTCIECHDAHALQVQIAACSGCHQNESTEEGLRTIRLNSPDDYDGDGDVAEGIAGEIETMHEMLYEGIQAYAADQGNPILYDSASYPYFFADLNENNELDEDEEGFSSWTPRLLKAAYNYTWVAKDPGAFAHNADYILQILYDSLEDIGEDVSGMVRHPVQAVEEEPQQ